MTPRGGISVHAVDVTRGTPACGLRVRILHDGALLAEGRIGARGTLAEAPDRPLPAGRYSAEFDLAAYFRSRNTPLPDPAFQEVSVFDFRVTDPEAHIHLPFKFSPWGFSLFRGTP